ncbi:hypothetical protein O59_004193 [Cellvibrio sp. BR]|uniref:cyclophilin-like fold protein n=1 Tax=Cellvibrio sp. BR TaxID=1134474 RepID=UPI0002600D89|nr:cyclophilin-like fold protein [Cellvibrio sp. BR]EIK43089.1 hypothetical protein O59_004193 [Cellvibrio sp. BR]
MKLFIGWKTTSLLLLTVLLFSVNARSETMKISITINDGTVINATLLDNDTTRDFVALLPLTLTLTDYNNTEKISDLPKKLSRKGTPSTMTPKVGDIAYYAPWGNLAIYYRDFGDSPGLIKLGAIDGDGIAALKVAGDLQVIIERQQ